MGLTLTGIGSYLPAQVMNNAALPKHLETSDTWIQQRTGIKQRHIAADGEYTSHLATHAAREALENAGIAANQLDLIILATTTPDRTFPATATMVQYNLGATCPAFDLQAVCSGFVYALATANAYFEAGMAKNILVIGAETMSRIVDWNDRGTCVLFGDGAGAVVVQSGDGDILAQHIDADGKHEKHLYVDGGPSLGCPKSGDTGSGNIGVIHMAGKEVFKHAVANFTKTAKKLLNDANMSIDQLDWFIPHQANERIITAVGDKLGLANDQLIMTVAHHANTSAASIPLALAVAETHIKRGDTILMAALGGGFTWGGILLKY